ncbi:MAG: hypothetical protein U0353_02990 [Sandaracinus sp.]
MSTQALGWAALVTVALLGLSPAAAHAQQRSDYSRLEGYGAFGFGGDAALRRTAPIVGDVRSTGGLEPTYGFGLRHTTPLHEYAAVSGLVEAVTMQWDTNGAERRWVFDFSVMPQLRFLLEVGGFFLEPYLGIPIGFTFSMLENLDDTRSPHGDEPWPGLNLGAMAGVRLITDLHFGAFVEAGWRHHQVWTRYAVLNSDYEANITHNQFALNAGVLWLY